MTHTGTIGGAQVPRDWNGTLLVFSHPYYVEGIPPGIGLSGRPRDRDLAA
jgi:hypothetical protein